MVFRNIDKEKMKKTHISKIIFNQEQSRFDIELLKRYFGESDKNGISSYWATVIEVIGNIYENPELLERN